MEAAPAQQAQPQPELLGEVAQQEVTAQPQVNGNGDAADDDVHAVEQQVAGMTIAQPESELHRACGEGKIEEVRVILSRGIDSLEALDMTTGCTPIVLAIRNNHADVVRELLSAGAIVPPPGLTSDPVMLSILYPQPMYSMPPFMVQPMSMGGAAPEFYPQPGFFPQDGSRGGYMPFPPSGRKDSSLGGQQSAQQGNGAGNLPPAEVAKTIPCRNFPNCKYGASCVFFHPRPQPGYFVPPSQGGFVPGYEQGYPPFQANGMPINGAYYQQPTFNPSVPAFPSQSQPQSQSPTSGEDVASQAQQSQSQTQTQTQQTEIPDHTAPQHDQITAPSQAQAQAIPVQTSGLSAFVPSFQPGVQQTPLSPPSASQYGLSPMSPSMLAGSLPSIPPAEAFFAASPPNGGMIPPPNGFVPGMIPANRRQSFNNPAFGAPSKPFGHGKKPSFSGGPRPWGRASVPAGAGSLGTWKDGNPPPCAFFSQGKCRNGEFCKFPHLDAEGNDCRHPDVVRGILPPLPSLSRQPRAMRMGANFGPFDPAFRHQQQMAFVQQRGAAQPNAEGEVSPTIVEDVVPADVEAASAVPVEVTTSADSTVEASEASDRTTQTQTHTLPASVPPKPIVAPAPQVIRSASQPGVQRVHANGISSRSHSPAPSNVSFHGNGHPRRGGSRAPFNGPGPHGSRSSSAGAEIAKALPQRVPGADEFPALGGLTEKKDAPVANGKTAAQVLSEPAPPKPVTVKVTPADGEESASVSSKSDDNSVTMDSDPDSDAVIISHKPSPNTTATPSGAASPIKRASVSFASVASSVASAATPLEPAPVGVKA
ncbi:hypothetical protein EHS25_002483 [Saitozyma podzolica]|uniref:C3H1-type domain-containing protein n=1 Tax=Saitozyma podzolica TaxID=1890683 RepID=A0A427YDX1_9TREE|nr:hypothetical protein EHS25_002483 [Saitozyma podzolica]